MSTTKADIRGWFEEGVADGMAYMVVLCDTFDYDDYPSYISPGANFWFDFTQMKHKEMTRVMEVYDLRQDMERQLKQMKAFNVPPRDEPVLPSTNQKQPPLTPCEKCGNLQFDYWPRRNSDVVREAVMLCSECKHPAEIAEGKIRCITIHDSRSR